MQMKRFTKITRIAPTIWALSATPRIAGLSTIGLLAVVLAIVLFPVSTRAGGLDPKADWPMYGGNTQQNKLGYNTNPAPLTLKWRSAAFPDSLWALQWSQPPILARDGIYLPFRIETNGGYGLAKFDYNGHLLWSNFKFPNDAFAESILGVTIDDAGNFWTQHYRHGGLSPFDPSTGEKKFTDPPCMPGATTAALSSPTIDKNGKIIVMSGSDQSMYSCNPDGSLNWKFSDTHGASATSPEGTPVISSDNTIYRNDGSTGVLAIRGSDGVERRRAHGFSSVNDLMLSFDEKTLFSVTDGNNLIAINVSADRNSPTSIFPRCFVCDTVGADTSSTLWRFRDIPANTKYFVHQSAAMGLGPDGTLFVSAIVDSVSDASSSTDPENGNHGHMLALDPENGKIIWDYELISQNGLIHAGKFDGGPETGVAKFLVDKANTIYGVNRGSGAAGSDLIAVDGTTGTLKFTYAPGDSFPSWRQAMSMDHNGVLYVSAAHTFDALWPWTISVQAKRINERQVQFSAHTTMQQKEPTGSVREKGTGANNLVQVYLNNGDRASLKFMRKNADGTTDWQGEYVLPQVADINSLQLTGQVEAAAQGETTATDLHFVNLPPRFFNSGVKADFSYKLSDLAYPGRQPSGGVL